MPAQEDRDYAKADLRRLVEGIWIERLKLDEVKSDTDFFWSGGHSLIAVQIVSRLRESLPGMRIPSTAVFQFPVFADFLNAMERLMKEAAAVAKPEP